jgi:hypothetical protein
MGVTGIPRAERGPVSRTDTSVSAPRPSGLALRLSGAPAWTAVAFLVSFALAAIALGAAGVREDGTALALRVTARWCFLLFWPAYAGGALAKLCGTRFANLARHGREFGLAFAAALSVHIGLVLRLMDVAADQRTPMLFFWAGVACTYALALFSLPRLRDLIGQRWWRIAMEIALQYIALVFADDFILEPLRANGADKYPLSYLPFATLLLGGVLLRAVVQLRRRPALAKVNPT